MAWSQCVSAPVYHPDARLGNEAANKYFTLHAVWYNRLEAGFVCTRNPMNLHQVSRVSLSPDVVDGFVFWTKNPAPMLDKLDRLEGFPYYFQFTLNAYGRDMEVNLPSKNDVIIPAFQALSRKIGPERTIWRYDPIILTPKYTLEYHMCNPLSPIVLGDCQLHKLYPLPSLPEQNMLQDSLGRTPALAEEYHIIRIAHKAMPPVFQSPFGAWKWNFFVFQNFFLTFWFIRDKLQSASL